MNISQKQKKALIKELDSFGSRPSWSAGSKGPAKARKPAKQVRGQRPAMATSRSVIGPSQRGISNVLGQRTDIPLEQPFAGSESLGRFNGSVGFTETQFAINPGQAVTFPWLSQEAKLWEKYEFDRLEFEFRTTISEFSANALGRVILGVDYDASDPPPSSRSQAEISRPVTAQAPYFNQRLILRKQDMCDVVKKRYVRPGILPGASDIKMYDVGNLNFGTDGNVNTNEVGELWVHYQGRFTNQILESATTVPLNNSAALFVSSVPEALVTGVAKQLLLANAPFNGILAVNTAGSIVLPAGNYMMDLFDDADAATNMTGHTIQILKNGAATSGVVPANAQAAAAIVTSQQLMQSLFTTSNGTDAFTVSVTVSGTGALTCSASLRIVAM